MIGFERWMPQPRKLDSSKTNLLGGSTPDGVTLGVSDSIVAGPNVCSLDYRRPLVLPFESSIAWPGTLIRRQTDPECMLAAIGRAL
ncbi:MAG: hypothetical protein DME59_18190 [Verrucomicrobia bacterium]|nr:MAG: hypothetical protein DME59_18190 [Verrucomicrobiota bacterium]